MTDKQTEALKLALEALEKHAELGLLAGATITAIKEALAQPEQEPVGEIGWAANIPNTIREVNWIELCPPVGTKLYTSPPQRTWVGLTEQEHTQIAVEAGCMSADWVFYGALVERKVKEKNT